MNPVKIQRWRVNNSGFLLYKDNNMEQELQIHSFSAYKRSYRSEASVEMERGQPGREL